jgi:hypothetical protein
MRATLLDRADFNVTNNKKIDEPFAGAASESLTIISQFMLAVMLHPAARPAPALRCVRHRHSLPPREDAPSAPQARQAPPR